MNLSSYVGAFGRDLWVFAETAKKCGFAVPPEFFGSGLPRVVGLAVLCHGLKGDPRSWHAYVDELTKEGWDVFLPRIPNGGNCSLEEASSEPCVRLKEHLERGSYGRVVLIGESNGTRVAHWLYHRTDWPPTVADVRLVSIAGFYRGIPWLASLAKPLSLVLDSSVITDFTAPDPLNGLPPVPEKTLYVATPHDTRFIRTNSSVPDAAPHQRLFSGQGHCSVKSAALEDVMEFVRRPVDHSQ